MSDIVERLRDYDIGNMEAADEVERLLAENKKLDDIRIDYICKINKLVDEREKLRKALAAILNDVGYHNPMRMATEISDKVLEDAAGVLNDYNI